MRTTILFLALVVSTIFFHSCKKDSIETFAIPDHSVSAPVIPSGLDFFSLDFRPVQAVEKPGSLNSRSNVDYQELYDLLVELDRSTPFTSGFIRDHGLPIWDESIWIATESEDDSFVLLPVASYLDTLVTGFIAYFKQGQTQKLSFVKKDDFLADFDMRQTLNMSRNQLLFFKSFMAMDAAIFNRMDTRIDQLLARTPDIQTGGRNEENDCIGGHYEWVCIYTVSVDVSLEKAIGIHLNDLNGWFRGLDGSAFEELDDPTDHPWDSEYAEYYEARRKLSQMGIGNGPTGVLEGFRPSPNLRVCDWVWIWCWEDPADFGVLLGGTQNGGSSGSHLQPWEDEIRRLKSCAGVDEIYDTGPENPDNTHPDYDFCKPFDEFINNDNCDFSDYDGFVELFARLLNEDPNLYHFLVNENVCEGFQIARLRIDKGLDISVAEAQILLNQSTITDELLKYQFNNIGSRCINHLGHGIIAAAAESTLSASTLIANFLIIKRIESQIFSCIPVQSSLLPGLIGHTSLPTALESFLKDQNYQSEAKRLIPAIIELGLDPEEVLSLPALFEEAARVVRLTKAHPTLDFEKDENKWLLKTEGAADDMIEFISENGGSNYSLSSSKITAGLGAVGLLNLTLQELEGLEAILEAKINGPLISFGLSDRTALASSMWYHIFQTEWCYGTDNANLAFLKKALRAVQTAIKEAWDAVIKPVAEYAQGVFESMPSTADEWFAIGSIMAPVLLDLGLDFVPIVGDVKAFAQAFDAILDGNYGGGALELVGAMAGILPVGDLLKSIPKVKNAVNLCSGAFKLLKNVKKISSKIFSKVKSLVNQGWKIVWDNGALKFKNAAGNVVARIINRSEHVVDVLDNFDEIVDLAVRRIESADGWRIFRRSDIDGAPSTIPTQHSRTYIGKGNLARNGQRIKVTEPGEIQDLVAQIQNGDPNGNLTETLSDRLYKKIYDGQGTVHSNIHYNNSGNGFDNVIELDDGTFIINEAKPLSSSGAISLNGANSSSGLKSQMSDDWIDQVITRMSESDDFNISSLAGRMRTALNQMKIRKVVTAVDKTNGEIVLVNLDNF